jgi:Flagellar assembly protein T, N-terminal domain
MRTTTLLKLSVMSLSIAASALAVDRAPDAVTREVTGEAAILHGNVAQAEKEARDRALREAVEQVAGVLVEADTLTANSQLVSDRIYANSAGYVRSYDVLRRQRDGDVLRVTVRAEVGTKELDKDLQAVKALVKRLGNRKLVILLSEQTHDPKGAIFSTGVTATELTQAFKADGWTIIDSAFAAGQLEVASGVSLGTPEVKRIKDLTQADYILYGQVNFRRQEPDSMLRSAAGQQFFPVTGEYDLAVFATDSGTQLGKVVGRLNFERPEDRGLQKSITSYERTALELVKTRGADIVKAVRGQVLETLRDQEQNGNRVAMSVQGLPDYAAVQAFKRALSKAVTGVRDVRPGNFGEGKAQFDVVFVGSTDDLAERVGNTTFDGKKVSVTGVSGNTLQVSILR